MVETVVVNQTASFQVSNGKRWKNLIGLFSEFNDSLVFSLDENGLTHRTLDASHVAEINFQAEPTVMVHSPVGKRTFMVSGEALGKSLNRAVEEDDLTFTIEDKTFNVRVQGRFDRVYTNRLLELESPEEVPIPHLQFTSMSKLVLEDFAKILDELKDSGDNVKVESDDNGLKLSASVDEDRKSAFTLLKGAEYVLDHSCYEYVKSTYNLLYLLNFVKKAKLVSDYVTMEFSKDMPMKISLDFERGLTLDFYLAPRVEAE